METITLNEKKHKELTHGKIAEHVSAQYAPISTELILQPFLSRGWTMHKTTQFNRYNKKLESSFLSQERIELRHEDFKLLDGSPINLLVTNSFDASKALNICVGIFRLICTNGLVMMTEGEKFRFIHRGTTVYEKLDNAYESIVAYLDTVRVRVEKLQSTELDDTQIITVLNNINKAVFNRDGKVKSLTVFDLPNHVVKSLTRIRREEDKSRDAYTVLNIVQENIVRFGQLRTNITEFNKETKESMVKHVSKRPKENKVDELRINSIITEEFLKVVA